MRHRRGPVILTISLVLPLAAPAGAAADEPSPSLFRLRPNSYGTELRDRADALPLVKATVPDIMNDLNRKSETTPVKAGGMCASSAVQPGTRVAVARSVCFNRGDDGTPEWYPQGVTTAGRPGDGTVLVSWYHRGTKGVRISFVDTDTGSYRHVLLVYPRANRDYVTVRVSQDESNANYNQSLHGGGVLWYGNYLFVADTERGFRVFDMRRIYDLGASPNGTTQHKDRVGLIGGTYYGHAYRYVMPQVGSWTRTAPAGAKCTASDGAPHFSYTSLDRGGPGHVIAGEYCKSGEETNGRVAVWPIAGAFDARGELITDTAHRWDAVAVHRLPDSNIQGAARFDGRWYLSRSRGKTTAGTLYTTEPTTSPTGPLEVARQQYLSIGPEDLSHRYGGTASNPALDAIWTVAEHPGKRTLYAVEPN